jgi:hypothetical protein
MTLHAVVLDQAAEIARLTRQVSQLQEGLRELTALQTALAERVMVLPAAKPTRRAVSHG